jgi:hypothetical protein
MVVGVRATFVATLFAQNHPTIVETIFSETTPAWTGCGLVVFIAACYDMTCIHSRYMARTKTFSCHGIPFQLTIK